MPVAGRAQDDPPRAPRTPTDIGADAGATTDAGATMTDAGSTTADGGQTMPGTGGSGCTSGNGSVLGMLALVLLGRWRRSRRRS